MELSEFEKAPRDPYSFDYWIHPKLILSSIGNFSVELIPESGEPDSNMVAEANKLASFINAFPEKLTAKVFERYQSITGNGDWLVFCGAPNNLNQITLSTYIEALILVVHRQLQSH